MPIAGKNRSAFIQRREIIAIAESSTGGLIAAALLAIPGASLLSGGAVVYTKAARMALLKIEDLAGIRPATEAYSLLIARRVRERHGAAWGLGETGATARRATVTATGRPHVHSRRWSNRAGNHVASTGIADRLANMDAFAKRALNLFNEAISAKS